MQRVGAAELAERVGRVGRTGRAGRAGMCTIAARLCAGVLSERKHRPLTAKE
ncbi:MAG: hypothetical protein QM296_13480 [Bacillota bacterium]|nr:hypothetical protein [Bacillota bacterium]